MLNYPYTPIFFPSRYKKFLSPCLASLLAFLTLLSCKRSHTDSTPEGTPVETSTQVRSTDLLREAILVGNTTAIYRLVCDGKMDVNAQRDNGESYLHLAVKYGKEKEAVIKLLLSFGARVNDTDAAGYTPLHRAAEIGNVRIIDLLLDHKADIAAQNREGLAPIHVAVASNHMDAMLALILSGASIQLPTSLPPIATPLEVAIRNGHIELARHIVQIIKEWQEEGAWEEKREKICNMGLRQSTQTGNVPDMAFFLKKGASINMVSDKGRPYSPFLYRAIKAGKLDAIQFLLENGASINHTGHKFPPLFCAVKKNDRGAVEALLKYNPPIKLTEIGGRCGVLHIAAEHTSSAMVRLLLNHNAKVDINFIDSECDTPLDIAAMNSKPDIVQLLLQNNANVDGEESEGEEGEAPEREKTEQNPKYTPLHCAAEAGNVPIIKALLDHGASISRPDEITESTPLHYAAQAGNRDAVFYLVGNGADVNAVDNDKNTPLHRAAMSGNPAVIKDLINSQADIRSKGEADFNLLHYVARHVKDPEMIKFIIENNPAAINEKNEIGEIPLDCAHERGNLVAIQVLSEYSEYNATTSVPNKEKYVLLQEAAESGHENVVRFLIETGVAGGSKVQDDPDAIAYNRMLLENKLANLGDNHLPLEVARFLIETGVERGSDVNQDPAALAYNRMLLENNLINLAEGDLPSEDKGSPLEWAVYQGNLAVVRSLIEQNPTLSNNDKNRLMRLAIWARHDSKDRLPIISLLLEKWGGIEAFLRHDDLPLEDERTPLGLAAYRGQLGVVRSLMEKKPIIPDKNRLMRLAIWTRPYSNSNSNDRLQIVSLLLEKLGGIEALDQDTQEAIKAYYRRPTALVLL